MSCYRPLKGLILGTDAEGKKRLKVVPYDSLDVVRSDGTPYKYYTIPCGHCLGCRQDQSREWSNRLLMESLYHDTCFFVTLTYDNDHLHVVPRVKPSSGEVVQGATLNKRDCQLFFKRLRAEFPDSCIRYYLAGEYGPKTVRPHYHAIIFGVPFADSELLPFGKSETGNPYYVCDRLSKLWSHGFTSCEPANYFTFKYVASYVTSKLGTHSNDYWLSQNLLPPFALMSRKPGIGVQYLLDHPEVMSNDKIIIGTDSGKVEFAPPRLFRKYFKEDCPELAQALADRHVVQGDDRRSGQLVQTDLDYTDLLKVYENNHESLQIARKEL